MYQCATWPSQKANNLIFFLCQKKKKTRKIHEKCLILESKLFQLRSKSENKDDSLDVSNNIENVATNQSPEEQPAKRKFGEHLTFTRKVVKLESSRQISPAMNIKASSIAGLSPLLKRAKASESYKLSPVNDEKSETYSILKKPRLIQNQVKKSDLRPSRLNHIPTLSTIVAEPTSSNQQQQTTSQQQLPPSSSLKIAGLNNRFRFGSFAKPN